MSIPRPISFIMPFHEPWDRPADFQRQTCLRLAKSYQVIAILEYQGVFWLTALKNWLNSRISSIQPHPKNLIFSQPIYLLPGKRWLIIQKLNQQLWLWWLVIKYQLFYPKKIWLWIFDPNFWFYPSTIPGWQSLYDCVDDHSQSEPLMNKSNYFQEVSLIKSVNLFTTNSITLAKLHQKTRPVNQVVVQGFDTALWPKFFVNKPKIFPDLAVFGSLDERIDWQLLKFLATKLPNFRFHLAGPISLKVKLKADGLLVLPNVTYHGNLPRTRLNRLLTQIDICLIPYLSQLQNVKNCFPMKILEYFAYGKPVIASQILELEYYREVVAIAKTKKNWLNDIKIIQKHPPKINQQLLQREIAWKHRYEQKIDQIFKLMKINS